MSRNIIERFDKNIKTFKNQDKRFDNLLLLIGGFGISLSRSRCRMSNRIGSHLWRDGINKGYEDYL
jgi:hypothetical protein